MTDMGPYRLLASREVYQNPWIRLREDEVTRPGGAQGSFGVIEMKAGSSVLAINEQNDVYLVKEYKYAIGKESTELISGAIEERETPLEAAKRELKEEVGLLSTEWIDLGVIDPFTTIVNSPNYLFLALGTKEGERSPDHGEMLETIKLPFSKALEMVMHSEITHAGSCVLILKADRYLRNIKLSPPPTAGRDSLADK